MSMETYDMLNGKLELYRVLDEGRKRSLPEVMRAIRQGIADDTL